MTATHAYIVKRVSIHALVRVRLFLPVVFLLGFRFNPRTRESATITTDFPWR